MGTEPINPHIVTIYELNNSSKASEAGAKPYITCESDPESPSKTNLSRNESISLGADQGSDPGASQGSDSGVDQGSDSGASQRSEAGVDPGSDPESPSTTNLPANEVVNRITDWDTYAIETSKTKTRVPRVKGSSCEVQNGSWYTGPASFAVDDDPLTSWTCNAPATVDFELPEAQEIRSINIKVLGVTDWGENQDKSGNYVKIYVDDKLVAEGTQGSTHKNSPLQWGEKTWLIQPTVGKVIRYETIFKPHLVQLQDGSSSTATATWSELGDLSVNGEVSKCTNKSCWNSILDKDIK